MGKIISTKRAFLAGLFTFIILTLLWVSFIKPAEIELLGRDFLNYYLGSKIVADGNVKQIYDINYQLNYQNRLVNKDVEKILPFRAPITTSYIYYPFTFLDPVEAYKMFVLLQLFTLSACIYILIKELELNLLYIPLLCAHPIVIINILQGQPSILLLFFISLSLLLFKEKKYILSGIAISLLLIKPQVLSIIFFLFILLNNNKFRLGTIIGSLGISLINLLTYGKNFVKDYLKFLQFTDSPYYGSHIGASHTIKSLLELGEFCLKVELSNYTIIVSLALIAAIGLFLGLKKRKGTIDSDSDVIYGLSVLITIPISIHLLNHDLVVLALPVAIIVSKLKTVREKLVLFLIYSLTWFYYFLNISYLYNVSLIGFILLLIFCYYYIRILVLPKR